MNISLIITTYNRPDALQKVLESALKQTQLPTEIIVADDGSTTETQQLVEQFQKNATLPILHCWQQDEGFQLAKIRNKAIAMAASPYAIMVDGDMVLGKQFIASHSAIAQPNYTIQGSRVLLSEVTTQAYLNNKLDTLSCCTHGISNRLNAINSSLLSFLASKELHGLKKVRGCNMAFWREDVIKVNGFNEAFIGWGREDSEFIVRMLNSGVRRKSLKFGGVGFHLYHPENTRATLQENDDILAETIATHRQWCEKGIDRYL